METSEQQRRPTIGQFAKKLKQAGLELNAVDLADMFWLAQFIELENAESPEEPDEPASAQKQTVIVETTESTPPEPTLDLVTNEPSPTPQPTETEQQSKPKEEGMTFPVPDAPAIRTRLDLGRSLRPLMRKVPSRSRVELDEEATVTRYAETRLRMPVVQPTPERWLDLDLVVEDSKTTILWERAITDLQHLMEYQGAFRAVKTWRLQADGQLIQLFARWNERRENSINQRPRSPRELIDPTGRRLILYLSDCTSALWRQGIVHETLWQWSEEQPLVLVQMLPERLWSRTALSDGHIVRLGALTPGLPSAKLDVKGLPDLSGWDEWDDPEESNETTDSRLLTLPIVTLNPDAFRRWAKVVAGSGDTQTPGRVFELAFVKELAHEPPISTPARTARQRVELFRATASKTARKLAGLMAATPVSLPVIDLLRDEFLPDAAQEHVAEVLLSGLLQRCDGDESEVCQYEFFEDEQDRVRDLLLDGVPISKTVEILDRLSVVITMKAGLSIKNFEALLTQLEESEDKLKNSALPFARIGVSVLKRLGGDYARLATQYESVVVQSPDAETEAEADDLLLEDWEYEVAQITIFPGLQTLEFEEATIEEEVETFEFETATITLEERRTGFLGFGRREQQWVIRKKRKQAAFSVEKLVDNIQLELAQIPAGTFTMGPTKKEEDEVSNSEPYSKKQQTNIPEYRDNTQHTVNVPAFQISRYPITQAQWRAIVTQVPTIQRDLNSNPSSFKGDNRPVERVSWQDAVEFCARLSQHTGKNYRLPSEAEWEYACRAGTETPFYFGEMITTELANYNGSSYNGGPRGENRRGTTEVGSFPANEWGLHDMSGNVFEWCADPWHDSYEGVPTDGGVWDEDNPDNIYQVYSDENLARLLASDRQRVVHGGSWRYNPRWCRSAYRFSYIPDVANSYIGFRVVCALPRAQQ